MPDLQPPASGITAELAAGISQRAVGLAFGEPQKVGDLHIVPVAFVSYGFGALDQSGSVGTGGGGGGLAIPLGVYVSDTGRLHFRANTVALLALLVPIVTVVGATVARVAVARS